MFVDPFVDNDIGHQHGFFGSHCCSLYPFREMILHYDDVFVSAVSLM